MSLRSFVIPAALAAVCSACQTVQTTKESAVGVNRPQHMMVSADAVNQSADKAYADVLKQAQQQNALDKDPATLARVTAIAKRLIPATGALRPDAPGWKWEMHVLSSKEVNAWCMPGGKIAVYTGLIDQIKPTDGELAAVMGHEIGHALREHGREQASQQIAVGLRPGGERMLMAQHLYSSHRSKADPGNGDKAQVEHEPVDRVLLHPEPTTIRLVHGRLHLRSRLLSSHRWSPALIGRARLFRSPWRELPEPVLPSSASRPQVPQW